MSQTIKVSDSVAEVVRNEAHLFSRSIGEQAGHWINIGRAIERSSNYNHQRITEALEGLVSPDDLTGDEQEVFFEMFAESMGETTPEQEAFFANRKKLGLGVGLDKDGNLVHQPKEI